MKLRVIYDPFLRQKVDPVNVFDEQLQQEADEMLSVMEANKGIGLAANQVGINKRLIVMGYSSSGKEDDLPSVPFLQLVNPRIIKSSKEKETMTEGCLSLPGLELPVVRSAGVTVEAFDLQGKKLLLKVKGLTARIIQHEIDHLDGILFTDRVDNYTRLRDYAFARIIFLGSDEFSVPILESIKQAGLNVMAVITETDKPAGRGQQLTAPLVKLKANQLKLPVFQPDSKAEITDLLRQLQPDLVITASYGKILPPSALAVPVYSAINVHPSLLPKYRGATPIQSTILAGDEETGVTIMEMQPEVDAGRLIAQTTNKVEPTDTTPILRDKLAELGASLLLKQLPVYLAGQAKLVTQDPGLVTKTKKLDKEMGEIDWQSSLDEIDRQIRALQPWPGTYTFVQGKRLKLLASHIAGGQLILDQVQLEGKKPTNWQDFQRGYSNLLKSESWYSKIASS